MEISTIEEHRRLIKRVVLKSMSGINYTFEGRTYPINIVEVKITSRRCFTTGFVTEDGILHIDPAVIQAGKELL